MRVGFMAFCGCLLCFGLSAVPLIWAYALGGWIAWAFGASSAWIAVQGFLILGGWFRYCEDRRRLLKEYNRQRFDDFMEWYCR